MSARWPRGGWVLRGRWVPRVPLRGRRRAGQEAGRPGGPGTARAPGADRGSSAVELVVLTPVLLALIWLIIQYALYYQGRQVALAAA
ncbi:MAG TPA: TadE family protein, partial [Streptosporangiaceae bacterium]